MSIFDYESSFFDDWLQQERLAFAVRDPRAMVKVVKADLPPPMPDFREDPWIPDGDQAFVLAANPELGIRREMVLLPKFNRYGERHPQRFMGAPVPTPLWTRHMLGVREAARDRRRRRHG